MADNPPRFTHLTRISSGASHVYRGIDTFFGRPCVLKVAPGPPEETEARRLVHELDVLTALSHPGVVRVLSFGFEAGGLDHAVSNDRPPDASTPVQDRDLAGPCTWLELESLEGPDIRSLHGAPLDRLQESFTTVLEVLDAIHRQGWIVADLKPEHILMTENGPRLVDFGLSRPADALGHQVGLRGTILYAAPEVLEGEPPSPASDLFSLGVILLEVLKGEAPFPTCLSPSARRKAWLARSRAIEDATPVDEGGGENTLSPWDKDIPTRFRPFLDAVLSANPASRPSIGEALALLTHGDPPGTRATERGEVRGRAAFRGRESEPARIERWISSPDARRSALLWIEAPKGFGRSRLLFEVARSRLVAADTPLTFIAAPPPKTHGDRILQAHHRVPRNERTASPDTVAERRMPKPRDLSLSAAPDLPKPSVLLIDDADAFSSVFSDYARRVSHDTAPLLIIAVKQGPPLIDQAGRIHPPRSEGKSPPLPPAEPAGEHLRLGPLDASTLEALAEEMSASAFPPDVSAELVEESGGNPGVLEVLLRSVDDGGEYTEEVAQNLEPYVTSLLHGTHADEPAVLHALARMRIPVTEELLGAGLGWPPDKLRAAVADLIGRGLLKKEEGRLRPVFPYIRHVLRARRWNGDLRTFHHRVLRHLERRRQLGDRVDMGRLAHHYDEAGDAFKAVSYLDQAMRESVEAGRWRDAHDFARRLARRLGPSDPERVRLLSELGDICRHRRLYGQARRAWTEALDLLSSEPEGDELVKALQVDLLRRRAESSGEMGDFSASVIDLRRAVELASCLDASDGAAEERSLAGLEVALARALQRSGDPRGASAVLRTVLDDRGGRDHLPPRLKHEAVLLDASLKMDRGELEEAHHILTQLIDRLGESAFDSLRRRALHNRHMVSLRLGRLQDAIRDLKAALEPIPGERDPAKEGAGYNNLGNLQRRGGDYAAAGASYRRALRIFERLRDRAGTAAVHYSLAQLHADVGQHAKALEHIEKARADASRVRRRTAAGVSLRADILRAQLLVENARYADARPLLENLRTRAEAAGDREAMELAEILRLWCLSADPDALEHAASELASRSFSPRLRQARLEVLTSMRFALAHRDAALWLKEADAIAPLQGERAFLRLLRHLFPPGGPIPMIQRLERCIDALEHAGLDEAAFEARQIRRALGASSQESSKLLDAVLDIVQHFGDRSAVLEHLVSLAARVFRAERGLLLHCRGRGEMIDFTAPYGMKANDARRASKMIIDRVARAGKPVIVHDAMEEADLMESTSIQDLSIRSAMGLPVYRDERGVWILYVDHRRLPGVFDDADPVLIERFSALVGGILKEIRWRESLSARTAGPKVDTRRYGMVGRSRAIERVREYIDQLGQLKLQNENLLFIGESGTGKELVARAVHQVLSAGKDLPYVAHSCADIPAELMESTLFGHRRGAFTGAREDRPGLFELANGGVLFLDEIGELPLNLQASLLRVLEQRVVSRVGQADRSIPLSLIVVCATNRDLRREVDAGRFRRDLFHRLNQVFRLPPLRERREDILPLLDHFMRRFEDFGDRAPEDVFSADALMYFHEYSWPGNIRELKNVVEAIPVRVKARRGELVHVEDVDPERSRIPTGTRGSEEPGRETLREFSERIEKDYIRRVMDACHWDITEASARLGLTYQGLRKRLIRYRWMDEVERHRRGRT